MPTHTTSFKTENSITPPSSPCSSHSSLSLEPLTSSPSNSSSCLNAESFSYNHLLSSSHSYADHIPSLLDMPTPSSPTSSLSLSSHHILKKRFALCQLEEYAVASKRRCEMADLQIATTSSLNVDDQFPSILHRNEVEGGAAECTGLATTGDFDDVLDLLLQDAEAAPASAMAVADVRNGGALATNVELVDARNQCPIFAYELGHCKEEINNEVIEEKFSDCKLRPIVQCASDVDALQQELWARAGGVRSNATTMWSLPKVLVEEEVNMVSLCEEWLRQRPSSSTLMAYCAAQQEAQKKEQKQGTSISPSSTPKGSSSRWAGPTLMDIESALAMTSPPSSTTSTTTTTTTTTTSTTLNYPPLLNNSSPLGKPPYLGSYLCSVKDILKQETSSFLTTTSSSCKEEPNTLEEDDRISTWRRLQKRNQMEPRYTVKIRCEEDAVNDGYRWRKYGQKSIKNSPHPRSYYRCSSGKCSVKKQVERSSEDAGVLVVSYEGIHLHHRPTSLPTTTSLLHHHHPSLPITTTTTTSSASSI